MTPCARRCLRWLLMELKVAVPHAWRPGGGRPNKLTAGQQRIVLRLLKDLTQAEVARNLGVSVDTIRRVVRRAAQRSVLVARGTSNVSTL